MGDFIVGVYQELTATISAKSPRAGEQGEAGLVSVVIATYDRPEQLARLLRSIGQQTYRHIETIIETKEIGRGAASNEGFLKSGGEFVIFPDDDMELDPTMIMKLLDALARHPSKAYAYCGFRQIDGDHESTVGPTEFDPLRLVLNGNYINANSLIRRSKFIEVGMFDPTLKRLIDWDLWVSFLDRGEEGILVPEVLFKHLHFDGPRISDDHNPRSLPYALARKAVEEKHSELRAEYIQNLRTELSRAQQQNAQLTTELDAIQQSAIFRTMKFLTKRIDKLLPEGTRRGELRKVIVRSMQPKGHRRVAEANPDP